MRTPLTLNADDAGVLTLSESGDAKRPHRLTLVARDGASYFKDLGPLGYRLLMSNPPEDVAGLLEMAAPTTPTTPEPMTEPTRTDETAANDPRGPAAQAAFSAEAGIPMSHEATVERLREVAARQPEPVARELRALADRMVRLEAGVRAVEAEARASRLNENGEIRVELVYRLMADEGISYRDAFVRLDAENQRRPA